MLLKMFSNDLKAQHALKSIFESHMKPLKMKKRSDLRKIVQWRDPLKIVKRSWQ